MPAAAHRSANLSVMTLAVLNVAAVLSIVNFPEQAEYGYQIIFYVSMSALFFFIPTALVSAEVASSLPEDGGLYLWGKTAFSPRVGVLTVSMQWLNSLPWFGTVLVFIATTLAYMFDPALAENRLFVYAVIVISMWACTLVNCFGIKVYARFATIGTWLGTVIPIVIMIVAAALYLGTGHAPAIRFHDHSLIPDLGNAQQFMLLAGMMVALAGIDMTALHITDVKNPRKNYPRAILIASIFIVASSIAGALAIALVVPPDALSMASGTGEAFNLMFKALHVEFLTPGVCVLLMIGALTTVFTWTLGPSKGLLAAADEGEAPAYLAYRNHYGAPVRILIIQAVIISLLSLSVFFMPTIGNAFWVMMALSAQLYMVMYLLLFTEAFVLRIRYPNLQRPYRIPGGLTGLGIVCALGFCTSLAAMIAGFVPPASIRSEGTAAILRYIGLLCLGSAAFITVPLLITRHCRRHNADPVHSASKSQLDK